MARKTNGTHVAVVSTDLYAKVARYRTALVALVDLVKRNASGYMSWDDQNLLRQVQEILGEDPTQ